MKWRHQFGYKAREATSKLVVTVSKAPNYTSPEWPFKASNHSFRPHPTPLDHLPTLPWQVFWIWTSEPNFEPLPIWIVPISALNKPHRAHRTQASRPGSRQKGNISHPQGPGPRFNLEIPCWTKWVKKFSKAVASNEVWFKSCCTYIIKEYMMLIYVIYSNILSISQF